jgi:hypothetical protein
MANRIVFPNRILATVQPCILLLLKTRIGIGKFKEQKSGRRKRDRHREKPRYHNQSGCIVD